MGRNSVDESIYRLDWEVRTLIGRDRTNPDENANTILDFLDILAYPGTGEGTRETR